MRRARVGGLIAAALVAALQATPSHAVDAEAATARADAAAVARWRPLAEAGDKDAQWRLGRAYLLGQGIAADPSEGVRWMTKCALQGSAPAAMQVAVAYENGKGVARSDAQAARWYLVAAKAGDGDAQRTLATWYAQGHGVAKDPVEALHWFYVAYGPQSPDEAVFVKFYLPDVGAPALERARQLARERALHP